MRPKRTNKCDDICQVIINFDVYVWNKGYNYIQGTTEEFKVDLTVPVINGK